MQTDRPRICERDVGWHLAERAGWLHEKKLLHARAYEMRGLEHGVEFLPGLSPLISGSVYLNRSLDSSRNPRAPGRDEEARESEARKSLRIHMQPPRDNGDLSFSLSLSLLEIK